MKRLNCFAITVLAITLVVNSSALAATNYKIDIDSTITGPISTETGWTSLDATAGNGSSVTVDGVVFSIASADGSRLRTSSGVATPNPLTADFVFDDGGSAAVILLFGDAGDLQAGTWQVDVYSWDATTAIGDEIVGYRENGFENIATSTATADPINPASSFTFVSNGTSKYDVFLRENGNDKTRLNAVELTLLSAADPIITESPILALDFNENGNLGGPNTQSGFQEFALDAGDSTSTMHSYGAIDVTLSANGVAGAFMQGRRRADPVVGGDFTQEQLFRDFAFARPNGGEAGLDVLLEGLDANTEYEVKLYSFDTGSSGDRESDWTANGDLKVDNYTFSGSVDPDNDDHFTMSFVVESDANGDILIEGRPNVDFTDFAVYLNGLTVAKVVPEPSTFILVALGLFSVMIGWGRSRMVRK